MSYNFLIYTAIVLMVIAISSCSINEESNLKVNKIFGDNMVLQKDREITVWGEANSGVSINAEIGGNSKSVEADADGKWKLSLPALKSGEVHSMKISAPDTTIVFNDILVGEVWLASGQSNMHLDMSRTLNGVENAKKADNPNIRIMYMQPTWPTAEGGVHTQEELLKLNSNKYFNYIGWNKADSSSIKNFSAVAYYFAEKLQRTLNVPVGIIHNAVPGSPIESWLSEKLINSDSLIKTYGENRWADSSDIMVSIGKKQVLINPKAPNFKLQTSNSKQQKHPWMPSYNYVNGIDPIKNMAIKGIIWYQGESNAEHAGEYSHIFPRMIKSWREDFENDFPFYYVQLSSRGDRTAWPVFRDMQRKVLDSIPNSGMVVTTDVGDKDDTHAKNKKPVGERLALLTLGKTYKVAENYESPVFDDVSKIEDEITISFKGKFEGLKTSDGKEVRGFEISYDGLSYEKVDAYINGNNILVSMLEPDDKFSIRYAWDCFTDANLVSGNGLPVSTFIIYSGIE